MRSRRMPALLTTPSSRPKLSSAVLTILAAGPGSATLSKLATACPPARRMSSTTSCAGAALAPSPSALPPRSLTPTLAPSRAASSAISRPMPRPAPVTSTTLSARAPAISCLPENMLCACRKLRIQSRQGQRHELANSEWRIANRNDRGCENYSLLAIRYSRFRITLSAAEGTSHDHQLRHPEILAVRRCRARVHGARHHALRARPRLRQRSDRPGRPALRLRGGTLRAADHGGGAGRAGLLVAEQEDRRRLAQDFAWRAGPHPAPPAAERRHGDRPHAYQGHHRQGRRQGRADVLRAPDPRQGERRADRDPRLDHIHARRRRVRRAGGAGAGPAPAAGARAGCRARHHDAAPGRADL